MINVVTLLLSFKRKVYISVKKIKIFVKNKIGIASYFDQIKQKKKCLREKKEKKKVFEPFFWNIILTQLTFLILSYRLTPFTDLLLTLSHDKDSAVTSRLTFKAQRARDTAWMASYDNAASV